MRSAFLWFVDAALQQSKLFQAGMSLMTGLLSIPFVWWSTLPPGEAYLVFLMALGLGLVVSREVHGLMAAYRRAYPDLEIVFDPGNPFQKFWKAEHHNGTWLWAYYVEVRNKSAKTLRNVSVKVETEGPPPFARQGPDSPFPRLGTSVCDLKPGTSELAPIFFYWKDRVPGALVGASARLYGPARVTVSADDVPPTVAKFETLDSHALPMIRQVM